MKHELRHYIDNPHDALLEAAPYIVAALMAVGSMHSVVAAITSEQRSPQLISREQVFLQKEH